MRFNKLFAAAAFLLFPALASADPCTGASPFTDVPASANYCTNTEWLKNRNVTLGCIGTNYCPNEVVTRASMALFMNRLADALVMPPTVTESTTGALTLTGGSDDNPVCATATIPAVNYPRVFAMTGHVAILGTGGTATVAMQVRRSLNGGGFSATNSNGQRVTTDSVYTANMSQSGEFTVPAGQTAAAHIGLFTVSGSTAIANTRCHLILNGQSVSGTSSPFDRMPEDPEGE